MALDPRLILALDTQAPARTGAALGVMNDRLPALKLAMGLQELQNQQAYRQAQLEEQKQQTMLRRQQYESSTLEGQRKEAERKAGLIMPYVYKMSADPTESGLNAVAQEIAAHPELGPEKAAAFVQTYRSRPVSEWASVARREVAGTPRGQEQAASALFAPPKAPTPTELSRLIIERDALPPGDPRRAAYDARINKETSHAPAPSASVNVKQESEEAKTVGKGFGEQYNELQKAGLNADAKAARYQRLGQLLEGVNTGKFTPSLTQLAAVADSVGIKVDPKLGPKQAAEALSNEVALTLRNPSGGAGMPGALSDRDREFLVSMTPGLAKTPEGNRLIIDTAKKLTQRDKDVARIAREYRKKRGSLDEGFYDELQTWSDAHPLFTNTSKPSNIRSEADAILRGGK